MKKPISDTNVSFSGDTKHITKIKIGRHIRRKNFKFIPCKPGDKIILYHEPIGLWYFYDKRGFASSLGINETCSFIVPDITGNSTVFISTDNISGTPVDYINFTASTGWMTDISPESLSEKPSIPEPYTTTGISRALATQGIPNYRPPVKLPTNDTAKLLEMILSDLQSIKQDIAELKARSISLWP